MSNSKIDIAELAQRIYDLDTEVYEASGSELGRSFIGQKEHCLENLRDLLTDNPHGYEMRSDLALVGNMARTISDERVKGELLRRYNGILEEIEKIEISDILDPVFVDMNESANLGQQDENQHTIICISRTEGSAGTDIGFALADKLHMSYYDSEVFHDVIGRQDREKDERYESIKVDLKSHPLLKNKTVRQLSRNHGLPREDAEFFNASALLKELAKTEDFVIVGRCADVILQNNHIPHTSVFITAPVNKRAKRLMELHKYSFKEACRVIAKSDRRRGRHYRYYTGKVWGLSTNYDLCINSARYGIEESVQLILRILGRAD